MLAENEWKQKDRQRNVNLKVSERHNCKLQCKKDRKTKIQRQTDAERLTDTETK
jgi:hypothetical protein